jgi:diguanylate cyclase (GGDEF)-like protein
VIWHTLYFVNISPPPPAEASAPLVALAARVPRVPLASILLGYALVISLLHAPLGDLALGLGLCAVIAAAAVGGARAAAIAAVAIGVYDLGFLLLTDHAAFAEALPRAATTLAIDLVLGATLGRLREGLQHERTQREKAENTVRFLATHDSLTALPNRPMLQDRLDHEIGRARREARGVGVMALGLDRFKSVNDTLGHDAGDQLLREAARRMQACLRVSDSVARLGGDEFVIILPTVASAEAAHVVGNKILRALEVPMSLAGQEVTLSASIGVALFPADGEDSAALFMKADLALARAKDQGRRSIHLHSETAATPTLQRMNLERGLRGAIERNEMVAYFQPQIDSRSGRIVGTEALLRWIHPERGMVPPNDFIPVAEDTGIIVQLGEWVLEAACRQTKLWQTQGSPDLRVAVNLSTVQLRERDLAERFAAVLERTGLEPRFLELELTEATMMRKDQNTQDQLAKLRAMGVRIAIDDFGTGYSSLSYLTRLPVDCLKVDRSFVSDLKPGSNTEVVVRAIMAIARSLSLRVVAEGVETEAQRDQLLALGADEMQGYLFSRPLPVGEAGRLLVGKRAARPQPAPEPEPTPDAPVLN